MDEIDVLKKYLEGGTSNLEGDIEIDIPYIGKKKISELEKYIPWYISYRSDLKQLFPKHIDEMIMEHARKKGFAKQKRMGVEDVEIPLAEMQENFETLDQQGYSTGQISKLLNVQPMLVSGYFTARRLEEEKSILSQKTTFIAWLKQRLR